MPLLARLVRCLLQHSTHVCHDVYHTMRIESVSDGRTAAARAASAPRALRRRAPSDAAHRRAPSRVRAAEGGGRYEHARDVTREGRERAAGRTRLRACEGVQDVRVSPSSIPLTSASIASRSYPYGTRARSRMVSSSGVVRVRAYACALMRSCSVCLCRWVRVIGCERRPTPRE
jgi:hypothetical protein